LYRRLIEQKLLVGIPFGSAGRRDSMPYGHFKTSLDMAAAVWRANGDRKAHAGFRLTLLLFPTIAVLVVGLPDCAPSPIRSSETQAQHIVTRTFALPDWNSVMWSDIRDSVVKVSNGSGAGTGFAVKRHLLVTCAHVIDDTKKLVYIRRTDTGKEYAVECVYLDRNQDIALLQTTEEFVPLSTSLAGEQEEVASFNYCGQTFSGTINDHSKREIKSNGTILHGFSGGPLVNRQGEVVGVNYAGGELPVQKGELNPMLSPTYTISIGRVEKAVAAVGGP
jgi:S1-C subfamily serine protease